MLIGRRAALRKLSFHPKPQHSAATATRLRRRFEPGICSKERAQVLVAVEINCAKPTRSFSEIHGYIYILNLKQRAIRFRFRGLKRPLDVRDERFLCSPLTGNKEYIVTKQRLYFFAWIQFQKITGRLPSQYLRTRSTRFCSSPLGGRSPSKAARTFTRCLPLGCRLRHPGVSRAISSKSSTPKPSIAASIQRLPSGPTPTYHTPTGPSSFTDLTTHTLKNLIFIFIFLFQLSKPAALTHLTHTSLSGSRRSSAFRFRPQQTH